VVSNKGQHEEKPRLWLTIARKCLLLFVAACMSAFGEIILCLVPRAPVVLAACERSILQVWITIFFASRFLGRLQIEVHF
jgi:hypothetical protein